MAKEVDTVDWDKIVSEKDLQPDEVDVVIYHSPCSDGTGSAWCAWNYLEMAKHKENVKFFPMAIGALPPPEVYGHNVLICDYSYKKDILLDLLKNVKKLLIIDHHISAKKDLEDIDPKYKIFDMAHSGAMLTWRYFFKSVEPPLLIKYIEDRDIWTKKLPFNDEFASWFFTVPHDIFEYDRFATNNDLVKYKIEVTGANYIELNNFYNKQACEYAVVRFCRIGSKYYLVAYVNYTINKSDIGNYLLAKYPFCDFSAVYSISDNSNNTSFSLRSDNTKSDVSEIATILKGGGHRNASGLKVTYATNYIGDVYDNGQVYGNIDKIYTSKITIGSITYDIVYLCSTVFKHRLGTYLLQNRYTDQSGKQIQVASDILTKLKKDVPVRIHLAAIWELNPADNSTFFHLVLDSQLPDSNKEMINKFFGNKDIKFSFGLKYSGINHTEIPITTKPIIDQTDSNIEM